MSYVDRFEVVASLYYCATGRLRPGKDEPAASGRDSSDDENRARFDNWLATRGFTDAIDRIAFLDAEADRFLGELDAARDEIAALKSRLARHE